MFADAIAFVCFYDADCVLTAISKLLVHLRGEMGDGRVEGRELRGKGRI